MSAHAMPVSNAPVAGMLTVNLEISIDAPREHVWRALTQHVDLWWPRDFFASANPERMQLDLRVGGALLEQGANGGGVLWYTIYALVPGTSLDLVGNLSPAFGGPAQSLLRLELQDLGHRTVLAITDGVVGNVGPRTAESNEQGWRAIFETSFKAFAERIDFPA